MVSARRILPFGFTVRLLFGFTIYKQYWWREFALLFKRTKLSFRKNGERYSVRNEPLKVRFLRRSQSSIFARESLEIPRKSEDSCQVLILRRES